MKTTKLVATISLLSTSIAASYTYKGCYKLSSFTSLTSKGDYTYQTNSYCQDQCSGYAIAATFDSGACYCGDTLPDNLIVGECDSTCNGYGSTICGGNDSLSVYVDNSLLKASDDKKKSSSISTTSSESTSTPASTSSSTPTTTTKTSPSSSRTILSPSTIGIESTATSSNIDATEQFLTSSQSNAAQSTITLAPSQTTIIYNIIQSYQGQTLKVTSTVDLSSTSSASATETGDLNRNDKSTNGHSSGLSKGAKIGIIVGCILGFLIVVISIVFFIFFKRQSDPDEDEDEDGGAYEKPKSKKSSTHNSRQDSILALNKSKKFDDGSDHEFDDSFSTTNVSLNSHGVQQPYSTIPVSGAVSTHQPHAYKSLAGTAAVESTMTTYGNNTPLYAPPTAMSGGNFDYRKRFSDNSLPDERKLRVINPDIEEVLDGNDSGYFDSYYGTDNDTLNDR